MTNSTEKLKEFLDEKLPPRFRNVKEEDIPEIILSKLDLLKEKKGLYIWGNCGIGKTHIAYSILATLAKRNYDKFLEDIKIEDKKTWYFPAKFYNWQEVLRTLRESMNEKLYKAPYTIDDNFNPKLLILDDLGAEKATDWTIENLYHLVNIRYEQMLPMIITSNLSLQELAEKVGDRIPSRIAEMCEVIKLEGKDRRLN